MKKALNMAVYLSSNYTFEFIEEILEKIPDWHVSVMIMKEEDSPTDREAALVNHGCTIEYYYDGKSPQDGGGRLSHLFHGVKKALAHFRVKGYDVIIINGVSVLSSLSALSAPKDARMVAVFWGSDLLRAGKGALWLMRPLLQRANAIVLETRHFADYFSKAFHGRYDDRVVITDFGTRNADALYSFVQLHTKEECKKKYGLPADKLCIFCGYNGTRAHRHKEIFHLLETLPKAHRDSICLVFHCAYGLDDDYKAELDALCAKSDMDCRLLTDFLTGDDLAGLRMCADVMLNLQPTDAFSASMVENMEAGAIVIKGDWLVYPELAGRGAYLLSIPSMEALPELIRDIVENPESYWKKTKQNRGVVLMQSWDAVRDGWMKALGVSKWMVR